MSTARPLLAVLLLGACTEHLSIGSIAPEVDAAAAEDAATRPIDAIVEGAVPPRDARSPEDAAIIPDAELPLPTPMRAWLRVLGREPISQLTVHCGAPCTEVMAVVEGGTPPYTFRWGDGQEGNPRSICVYTQTLIPAPDAPPAVLEVTDATPSGAQQFYVQPALSTPGECARTDSPSWDACIAPHELGAQCNGDAAGLWYDMVTPWTETSSQARLMFSVSGLASATVEVYTATSLCEGLVLLGTADVSVFTLNFELQLLPLAPAPRYLVLRVPSSADGLLPAGISPSVSACFVR